MIEDQADAITVLDVRRVDDHVQEEAADVDENMAFAALDLLARIAILRVYRGRPVCALLALRASTMAAVGFGSRSAFAPGVTWSA
jgi:hypothetical protein